MKGLGSSVVALVSGLAALAGGLGSSDTITWGGDNTRAGYQTTKNMDPAVVGSSQFGQIFRSLLPGRYRGSAEQIFSQPLVYTPSGGTRQFVYVATTQNNLYKLDAKTGEMVASRNLHIPFLTDDLDGCVDINPTIGVIATGVVDPDTDTLYLTAKTYRNQDGGDGPQGRANGRYYVHAVDANDLSERPNFPLDLEGLVATNSAVRVFAGGVHLQRPALLHTGEYVYAAFGSHCVQYDFTGWIIGWHRTTGKIVEAWATEGSGVPADVKGGGIWMSGGGLSSDDAGSIFLATGNGYASQLSNVPVKGFSPPTALEQAALHMTVNGDGSLSLVDFFMPWEKQALDGADKDLGTSPLEILPSQFACGDVKRIGVVTGKSGKTYFLNLDNLGGYRNGPDGLDDVLQVYLNPNSVYAGAGVYPLEGGYVYVNPVQYPTSVFKYSCNAGRPSFAKVAESPAANAYILGVSHGTVTSLNGQEGTGLLWVTDVQGLNLKIFNAVPKDGKLVMINSFNVPGATKFGRPVFGDGTVYVGTTQGYLYAFGAPVNSPLNCTSPLDFGGVNIRNSSAPKPLSCVANIDLTVTGVDLDKANFRIEAVPPLPLPISKGQSFSVDAVFNPARVGFISDDVVVNTTNGVAGFSTTAHARLTGTGRSAGALLGLSPNTVTFQGLVTGQDPDGVSETLTVSNRGNSPLLLKEVLFSANSSIGPFQPWYGPGDLVVGKFTLQRIPATIDPNQGAAVNVKFDSSTSGTYAAFVKFTTNGGNGTVAIAASSGPPATALLEFQTPDGQGWVEYVNGTAFRFGNVTENTSRSLKFRITNAAAPGAVKLSLTVSKPPFGVRSIVRAANQVDLAEGSSFAPGESGTAVLSCTAPKSQWNVDAYGGAAQWTLNTNDPFLGKQFVQFHCDAVAEQAPPLLPGGQGRYRYLGCFQDNIPGRQLPKLLSGDDLLTNARCMAACSAAGSIFCGTQYHRECWAGNAIPLKKVDDVNCNYYCAGDINQVCGGNGEGTLHGGSFISLFADSLQWNGNLTRPPTSGPRVNPGVAGYDSIGCYTEATNARALPKGAPTDQRTVAACITACKDRAFAYAGVEYGGECWCGSSLGAGSVPAPDKDCSMTCNGIKLLCTLDVLLNHQTCSGEHDSLDNWGSDNNGSQPCRTCPWQCLYRHYALDHPPHKCSLDRQWDFYQSLGDHDVDVEDNTDYAVDKDGNGCDIEGCDIDGCDIDGYHSQWSSHLARECQLHVLLLRV
ncbi:hypothetical protein RJ55_02354 [Drechmeria coniospora]|nr:hypothetical protein RJ55_02354 [Drechmeria coniospora]